MPERAVLEADCREHPAFAAWSELRLARTTPETIEVLKYRSGSEVYRLTGAGPGGFSVIAKRYPKENALAERTIYQKVLPHLPFPVLRYYGLLDEKNSPFCWVFIEDAGGVQYSPEIQQHRVLAAEWLGAMHTSAVEAVRELGLPDRGASHYLGCLRSARDRICGNLSNPALSAADRTVLNALVSQCNYVEERWGRIEECCDGMPEAFVHADLQESNVHVRISPRGTALLPFDWECAGWAVPAIDLVFTGLDMATYCSVVRRSWPALGLEAIRRLAPAGKIFQLVALIDRESDGLGCEWLYRPMKRMRCYHGWLSDAIRTSRLAGWVLAD